MIGISAFTENYFRSMDFKFRQSCQFILDLGILLLMDPRESGDDVG
jgi:hypothetical protein